MIELDGGVQATLERLTTFDGFEEDWDSYGAHPVTPAAMEKSVALVTASGPHIRETASVDAVPTPSGGMLIEWRGHVRRLQVVVSSGGHLSGMTATVAHGHTLTRTPIKSLTDEDVMKIVGETA